MREMAQDILVDQVCSFVEERIKNRKEEKSWIKLFVETGDFLTGYSETDEEFKESLLCAFSEENMRKLAEELKGKTGFQIQEALHDSLYNLMVDYEIEKDLIETYIHHFSQAVFAYIEEKKPDTDTQRFLAEMRKKEDEDFIFLKERLSQLIELVKQLGTVKKGILSIPEVHAKIRHETQNPKIGLDFFEIDDEQFLSRFHLALNQNQIFVVGKSREETTYCILRDIQKQRLERTTFVVTKEEDWNRLENTGIRNAILIPFFYADSILAIEGNTNIFVYGEDEACCQREPLLLRRRTKQTMIHCMEHAGVGAEQAYRMVEDTHGLYIPLKKKMWNGASYRHSSWYKPNDSMLVAALLCGKWQECEGDQLIFEELSGFPYEEWKKQLPFYIKRENPFVVEIDSHRGRTIQLACVEDAWENLDSDISEKIWNKFVTLLYEVLIVQEPIFDLPVEKHFEAGLYVEKPEFTPELKQGMIRSLIMRAVYRRHEENQAQVDEVVRNILHTIDSKKRWNYIAQYITDLCEASPKAVLERLEAEWQQPTGMLELFRENDGDPITGRHYYTHILWAAEQLLLQKRYAVRVFEWLWKLNDYGIKYRLSNSPQDILKAVLSSWINESVFTVEQKIEQARQALKKHASGWEIISSELPTSGSICSPLNPPKYRDTDEIPVLYKREVNKTYIAYLQMCIENADGKVDRWIRILSSLDNYYDALVIEAFEKLNEEIKSMSDESRILVKNKIRSEIYRHRFFADADWSMPEKRIALYETMLKDIHTKDPVYEYLYLFSPTHDFPLQHPVPFKREDYGREQNNEMREREIEAGIIDFQKKGYSLKRLLELDAKNVNSNIGIYLALYYGNRSFQAEIFEEMLEVPSGERQIYDYVRCSAGKDMETLRNVIQLAKKRNVSEKLLVDLFSLEPLSHREDSMIGKESPEIKKAFWSCGSMWFPENDPETFRWMLRESREYGTVGVYLTVLFEARKELQPLEIFEAMEQLNEVPSKDVSGMSSYCLEEIIKVLQTYFLEDDKKCRCIAGIEMGVHKILEWEDMRCTQRIMKKSPELYAELVKILYIQDGEKKGEKKNDDVNSVFDIFYRAHFCPAEENGKVDFEKLKAWADDFKLLLQKQNQSRLFTHLLGRLLAYSPVGKDNCRPCEAVRQLIEEIYDDSLKSSYMVEEINKRGVYSPDAGKTEREMAESYKWNAENIRMFSPHTAMIYDALSDHYRFESERERRSAEDEW